MIYSFSTFAFDAASLELTRQGRRVSLEPQPARALALLVSRAGEVVSRDEMRQAIWGAETHVDYDRGLAYCIGQVRSALHDSAEQPRFVQTLPKRGFRFLAPVSLTPPPGIDSIDQASGQSAVKMPVAESAPGSSATTANRRWAMGAIALLVLAGVAVTAVGWRTFATATVAVSIFDNETGDPSYDALVTGLSDLVVTELTNLSPGRIGVVGNAAALRQPRNIRNLQTLATAVDADYVILGQLQRQDERLRFIVHLIRLIDGVHLSAQRFIRPASEVAAFEAQVVAEARRVVQHFLLAPDRSSLGTPSR